MFLSKSNGIAEAVKVKEGSSFLLCLVEHLYCCGDLFCWHHEIVEVTSSSSIVSFCLMCAGCANEIVEALEGGFRTGQWRAVDVLRGVGNATTSHTPGGDGQGIWGEDTACGNC